MTMNQSNALEYVRHVGLTESRKSVHYAKHGSSKAMEFTQLLDPSRPCPRLKERPLLPQPNRKTLDNPLARTHACCLTMKKKPKTIEEMGETIRDMGKLLIECRDAICYIPVTAVRLGNVSPSLAERIESTLEPWIDPNGI